MEPILLIRFFLVSIGHLLVTDPLSCTVAFFLSLAFSCTVACSSSCNVAWSSLGVRRLLFFLVYVAALVSLL